MPLTYADYPQDYSQGQNQTDSKTPNSEKPLQPVPETYVDDSPAVYPVPEKAERSDKLKLEDLVGKVWYSLHDPTLRIQPESISDNVFVFLENGIYAHTTYGYPETGNYEIKTSDERDWILFYKDKESLEKGDFKLTQTKIKKTESGKNLIFSVEDNKKIKFTDNRERALRKFKQKLQERKKDVDLMPTPDI